MHIFIRFWKRNTYKGKYFDVVFIFSMYNLRKSIVIIIMIVLFFLELRKQPVNIFLSSNILTAIKFNLFLFIMYVRNFSVQKIYPRLFSNHISWVERIVSPIRLYNVFATFKYTFCSVFIHFLFLIICNILQYFHVGCSLIWLDFVCLSFQSWN